MLLIVHHSDKLIRVKHSSDEIDLQEIDLCKVFWKCAEMYPDEIIAWCDSDLEPYIIHKDWSDIFHHNLVMASYAIKTMPIGDSIGYIDQLPFIHINYEVLYPTWRMSTDVGGIKGKTLLKFKSLFGKLTDFGILINSVAKLGQQNGLFCYSAPSLINHKIKNPVNFHTTRGNAKMFGFVYSHYKNIRVFLLLWCLLKYERSFPIISFINGIFQKKVFKKKLDFSEIPLHTTKRMEKVDSIDVIIPSLGRSKYLLQVLNDLKQQTLKPEKVVIVEQNPDSNAQTGIPEVKSKSWPFEIIHYFIHQTGACHARNIALDEVNSDWVFFADDDNRIAKDLLQEGLKEIKRIGTEVLTFRYAQKNEKLIFDSLKQWGTFGAGNSLVAGDFAKKIRFDKAFENGYAEDKDYGMQLRNAGCDIVYHPGLEILHLKAPRGGFREVFYPAWEMDRPKPSPTLMVYAKKYFSIEELRGFKTELFLRFYRKQEIKNPYRYYKLFRQRWQKSEEWSDHLIQKNKSSNVKARIITK